MSEEMAQRFREALDELGRETRIEAPAEGRVVRVGDTISIGGVTGEVKVERPHIPGRCPCEACQRALGERNAATRAKVVDQLTPKTPEDAERLRRDGFEPWNPEKEKEFEAYAEQLRREDRFMEVEQAIEIRRHDGARIRFLLLKTREVGNILYLGMDYSQCRLLGRLLTGMGIDGADQPVLCPSCQKPVFPDA